MRKISCSNWSKKKLFNYNVQGNRYIIETKLLFLTVLSYKALKQKTVEK